MKRRDRNVLTEALREQAEELRLLREQVEAQNTLIEAKVNVASREVSQALGKLVGDQLRG